MSGTGNIVLEGGTASGNVDAYYKITQDAVSGGNVDLTYKVGNDTYSIRGDVIPVGSTVVVTATPQSDYKVSSGTYTIGDDATKFSIENFSSSTAGQKVIGEFTPNNGPIKVAVTFAYVSSGGGDHGGGGGGGGGGGSSSSSSRVTVASTTHGRVTVSPDNPKTGDTVTITATPDKGYTLESLTVLDKDGKALTLTDKGGGKYTFVMPAGKVMVKAVFMDDNTMLNFFTDVHAEDYYYDAVLWAAQKGHYRRYERHAVRSERCLHPSTDRNIPVARGGFA